MPCFWRELNPFSAYLVHNPATTLIELSRTDEALEYACMLIYAVCHVSELAATYTGWGIKISHILKRYKK
jgi:hypothetical protein